MAATGNDFRHHRSKTFGQQVGMFVPDMGRNRKQISWPRRNKREWHFDLGMLDPKMFDRPERFFAALPCTVDAGDGLENDYKGLPVFLCELRKRVQTSSV